MTSRSFYQYVMSGRRDFVNNHNKRMGLVCDQEYTTFLMSWLECFVFYSSSLGSSFDMQTIAKILVQGNSIPLGQYL
jgi:hypothetical protein